MPEGSPKFFGLRLPKTVQHGSFGDPARFTSSRTVGAHFGLTPRRYQSGERDAPDRISRAGDRDVRATRSASQSEVLHCQSDKCRRRCHHGIGQTAKRSFTRMTDNDRCGIDILRDGRWFGVSERFMCKLMKKQQEQRGLDAEFEILSIVATQYACHRPARVQGGISIEQPNLAGTHHGIDRCQVPKLGRLPIKRGKFWADGRERRSKNGSDRGTRGKP